MKEEEKDERGNKGESGRGKNKESIRNQASKQTKERKKTCCWKNKIKQNPLKKKKEGKNQIQHKQNKTKQNKTKQNKTKQNKTKQNKTNKQKETIAGLYTSGWLKRGPTGVIVSTMMDAQDTAATILEDLGKGLVPVSPEKKGGDAILSLLQEKGVKVVSFKDWKAIDAYEVAKGAERKAPREKLTDINQMLAVAGK
jgi:NADPH-dependent glutamate synthase beta subunit-like oxidoreductase